MWVDTINRKLKKKVGRKPISKLWFLPITILLLAVSFFYFGRLGANYLLENIEPISLLKNGKFLVLFQNNAEIRSSGGFIGSYAVAKIENYEIRNLDFNTNILALDRIFTDSNYVEPPAAMKNFLKNSSWALRDANYNASFPDAVKDILKFYSLETGDQVDGVIAFNAQVMVDLLKTTGPIYLDKYKLTITADNFYDVTQYQVEKQYFQNPENWVINEPKTFLKDLYPEIIKHALDNKIEFAKLLKKELENKEIIFYFVDSNKEQIAENYNWAGKIPTEQELKDFYQTSDAVDYLYINSNSYSGDKSSIEIDESVDYQVTKTPDGQLEADLKITRIHTGSFNWPDGANRTWTRVFVPNGATLLGAQINGRDVKSEMTIGSEADKTFFGREIFANPGDAYVFELTYLLPFKTDSDKALHLLVQKQPGVAGDKLTVLYQGELLYNGILDSDKKL